MRLSTVKFCIGFTRENITNVIFSFMEHGRAEYMNLFSAMDFFAKLWVCILMQYCKPLILFPSCTKGMHYLHMEAPVKVIHRDLKSRNGRWLYLLILLFYYSSPAHKTSMVPYMNRCWSTLYCENIVTLNKYQNLYVISCLVFYCVSLTQDGDNCIAYVFCFFLR